MNGDSGSLARARSALEALGLADRLLVFDDRSTKTAQLAAEAVGCDLGQIVKSLVFMTDERAVLALVAGDRKGDAEAIAQEAGGTTATFADADQVRSATGYAIGGVCPFDLPAGLEILLDDSLRRFDLLYTAAGTPNSMVGLSPHELETVTGGRWTRIAKV